MWTTPFTAARLTFLYLVQQLKASFMMSLLLVAVLLLAPVLWALLEMVVRQQVTQGDDTTIVAKNRRCAHNESLTVSLFG